MVKKFKVDVEIYKSFKDNVKFEVEVDDTDPKFQDLIKGGMSLKDIAEKMADDYLDNLIKNDKMVWDAWELFLNPINET